MLAKSLSVFFRVCTIIVAILGVMRISTAIIYIKSVGVSQPDKHVWISAAKWSYTIDMIVTVFLYMFFLKLMMSFKAFSQKNYFSAKVSGHLYEAGLYILIYQGLIYFIGTDPYSPDLTNVAFFFTQEIDSFYHSARLALANKAFIAVGFALIAFSLAFKKGEKMKENEMQTLNF